MKIIKLITLLFITTIVLFSCSSTKIVRRLNYNIDCSKCGTTDDGVLELSAIKKRYESNDFTLRIKNLSDQLILIDQRYMTISDDNMVAMSPIGLNDVYSTYSYTEAYETSLSKISQYLYNPLDLYASKYGSNVTNYTSTTENTLPDFFIPLPNENILNYPIYDYLEIQFESFKEKYSKRKKRRRIIDFKKVKESMNNLEKHNYQITVVYRLINESNWRSASIEFSPRDFKIISFEIKR